MNKWITISIIVVLLAGVGVTGVLYTQETGKLKDAQAEIVGLEGDVSTLEGTVSTLEADLAAAEAEVARLDGELTVAEAQVSTLEGDLTAAETQVSTLEGNVSTLEAALTAAEAQVSTLQADLTAAEARVLTLEGDLAAAQAQVSTLEADLADARAQVATLSEELQTVKDPRHFTSLQELTNWLAQDDTDTTYPFTSTAELAFILQVRALRDGYLLPADVYPDGIGFNWAYIGSGIYAVFPEDDSTFWWDIMEPVPSHPLPLG